MNKAELISTVAERTGLKKKDVTLMMDETIGAITESLSKKESVSFLGFGTFSTSERKARDGVNPSTGAKIKIAASTVAKFKVGAGLKEAVKSGTYFRVAK